MNKEQATSTGISMVTAIGCAIAVQISWGLAHSIPWAERHGLDAKEVLYIGRKARGN